MDVATVSVHLTKHLLCLAVSDANLRGLYNDNKQIQLFLRLHVKKPFEYCQRNRRIQTTGPISNTRTIHTSIPFEVIQM